MNKPKILRAGPDDICGIVNLFNKYVTPKKTESFFHWWNQTPSVVLYATFDDEIVGTFVVIRRTLTDGTSIGVLMGMVVDREWRGGGLFSEMGKLAMSYFPDISTFCCLTNASGKKALERSLYFETIGTSNILIKRGSPLGEGNFYRGLPPITVDYPVAEGEPSNGIEFVSDWDFKKWRYAMHPYNTYRIVSGESSNNIVVNKYQSTDTGYRYVDIVDFNDTDLFDATIPKLSNGVEGVTAQAIPGTPLYRLLLEMGFVDAEAKHFICIRSNKFSHFDCSKWVVKWGDYLR